nr:MAG TPA: hypothetical protein [Caudoviricetes sp.]
MTKVVTIRARVAAIAMIWTDGAGRFVLMAQVYERIRPACKPQAGRIW